MKIENDSYYIRYEADNCEDEYASITHFIDVWDNGYRLDTYGFCPNRMNFEAACWNGVTPDDKDEGKRIDKQLYCKWEKMVIDCKNNIIEKADKSSSKLGEVHVGDYLYFTRKDKPLYWLLHITGINESSIKGATIYFDRYDIINHPEPEHIEQYGIIDQSRLITKEVFDYASELILKTTTEIMAEIKKRIRN